MGESAESWFDRMRRAVENAGKDEPAGEDKIAGEEGQKPGITRRLKNAPSFDFQRRWEKEQEEREDRLAELQKQAQKKGKDG